MYMYIQYKRSYSRPETAGREIGQVLLQLTLTTQGTDRKKVHDMGGEFLSV